MKAIITVLGKDKVGIISGVSNALSNMNINILDISQTIMNNVFTMIMQVDIAGATVEFSKIAENLRAESEKLGVEIRIQHEDIFNSMHRI